MENKNSEVKMHVIKRLSVYLLQHKWLLGIAIILSISSNMLALLGPRLSGYAIDSIEFGPGKVQFQGVFYYCGLMILFYIFASILSYMLAWVMLKISRGIAYQLRKDLFDRLLSLPVSYFDTHSTGNIISKISYDIDTVNTSLSSDLVSIVSSIITVIGSFSMMVSISPKLVLVFVFTVPLSVIVTKKITGVTRPMFRKRSGKMGELNGLVEELISGQKTLKAYHQEENTIQKFKDKNKDTVDAYYNADYYGAMVGPSVNFMNNISLTLISVFGAILYLRNAISLGNISSFVLYSRKFSGPINESANIMSEFQSAFAAAERIFRLMDELPESADAPDAIELQNVEGTVDIEHVSFGYELGKTILHDMNLHVKPGNMIAVVGPTGAGKTTLINLLMRFYDVTSGAIYVDGNEIRRVTRDSLRKAYSMVLQDTWLFNGTIYENIAYGKEGATMEDVVNAAKAAKIHSYIMSLPDEYDTLLTDDGTNISKGQKQLLTIARAMLLETHMLILDEATSNVDTRTEIQIQEAMRKLMEGKTCFIIAHRLSTIRNADHILVVQNGEIVEQGNHEFLMQQKGFYSQMYYSQFE